MEQSIEVNDMYIASENDHSLQLFDFFPLKALTPNRTINLSNL